MSVPRGLAWWRGRPGGAAWLERLPRLVAECAELWSLALEEPYHCAHVSYVAPARLPDGRAAVLKVNFPEPESEHEAAALGHWAGEGAVRLYAEDRERRALLVERCEPGTRLWERPGGEQEANAIAAGVLRRLWRPPPAGHCFRLLADEAARWSEELPARWEQLGRPYERRLLDEAVAFLRSAGADQGEPAVLHQDFHGGNVLAAEREPWLAHGPKPLVGEREFDTASLLRDRRWELRNDASAVARMRRRLDFLAVDLELDRDRMRGWGMAHALAWDVDGELVPCARWLVAAR